MLRTFGLTQAKPAQYVACSYTSTQMCTNLSHPPLVVDAKNTVPCSDDLLVSRKNGKKLVTKHLGEIPRSLCWMFNALQNLKSWVYYLLVLPHGPLFSHFYTWHFFLSFCLLVLGASTLSRALSSGKVSSFISIFHLVNRIGLWLNVVKLPRIL